MIADVDCLWCQVAHRRRNIQLRATTPRAIATTMIYASGNGCGCVRVRRGDRNNSDDRVGRGAQ
jgi:hypothetical protein